MPWRTREETGRYVLAFGTYQKPALAAIIFRPPELGKMEGEGTLGINIGNISLGTKVYPEMDEY